MSSEADFLVDRMQKLLSTGDGADVHFLVGKGEDKELICAHQLILKTASEVFDGMFQIDSVNGKAEDGTWEVISSFEVTDVEVGAFKVMLNFIYANDLEGLNGHNAMAVLYAAKKFGITALMTNACANIAIWKLPNVFFALSFTRSLGENDFALRCLAHIELYAETLIETKEFLEIDQNLLCEILGRDQLRVSGEIGIWKAALRWADEKCRQNGIECSGENRRAVLGPALLQIRFPRIPTEEFEQTIIPSDVLTKDQMFSILMHSVNPKRTVLELFPLHFPTKRRTYICRGMIEWKIEKFSELANDKNALMPRSSDATIIRGIPWVITVSVHNNNKPYLYVQLKHTDKKKDGPNWNCFCSASFRIRSQKEGKEDLVSQEKRSYQEFKSKSTFRSACLCFMPLQQVMDPDNGCYNEKDDSVTVVTELFVDENEQEEEKKEE